MKFKSIDESENASQYSFDGDHSHSEDGFAKNIAASDPASAKDSLSSDSSSSYGSEEHSAGGSPIPKAKDHKACLSIKNKAFVSGGILNLPVKELTVQNVGEAMTG
jgi:hypothetical protein